MASHTCNLPRRCITSRSKSPAAIFQPPTSFPLITRWLRATRKTNQNTISLPNTAEHPWPVTKTNIFLLSPAHYFIIFIMYGVLKNTESGNEGRKAAIGLWRSLWPLIHSFFPWFVYMQIKKRHQTAHSRAKIYNILVKQAPNICIILKGRKKREIGSEFHQIFFFYALLPSLDMLSVCRWVTINGNTSWPGT